MLSTTAGWAVGCPLCPQFPVWQLVPRRSSENVNREEKGKLCPLKAMLGLVSKESQQCQAVMRPPLWTFVPTQ